ncbi:MAG: hypothetical protein GY789_28235 [Hyphomicrobiales bacterium]|nr:hypothetical protein [Hyphomicrobiales bacterium]MCP5000161.1 hypothetical protein [Hyphomicrobiales bacterium]
MQNEHFTTDIAKACELCGLSGDTFSRETPAAWERLANLYLNIQVAADVIASSDGFDPDNPETYDTEHLEDSFPPGTVAMIMRVATLMGLAIKDVQFSEPQGTQKPLVH